VLALFSGAALTAACAGPSGPGEGQGELVGHAAEASNLTTAPTGNFCYDPTCTNVGDYTVDNPRWPRQEKGVCGADEYTFAQAVSVCNGGQVKYFGYYCGDSSFGTHTWTATFGCCAPPSPPPTCGAGLTDCCGACADLTSDTNNCGACGTTCAAGQTCSGGVCVQGPLGCSGTPTPIAGNFSGAELSDVAYDNAGNLYVSEYGIGDVRVVPAGGSGTGAVVSGSAGSGPLGLAHDASTDTIYMGYYYAGEVRQYSPSTQTTQLLASGLCGPAGMAVSPVDHKLYVGSRDCGTVYQIDAQGNVTSYVSVPSAYDVAFDSSGNMFIADWAGGGVYKVAAGTQTATVFAAGLITPDAVMTDASGNVYVGPQSGEGVLHVFAPDGTPLPCAPGVTADSGLRAGLVFDSSNHIVFSDIGTGYVYRVQ
jgi:DNA-binding beta-propeller fold protein YncE